MLSHAGPDLIIDPAIQWCVIPTPVATTNDLWITKGANTVTVNRNTAPYRTNHWALQFATAVGGVWSTNIQTTVVYSNNVASATFASTNPERLYRLKHQ